MQAEPFGQTGTGEEINRVRLNGGGLSAAILTWGATLQDLRLADHPAPLVLGFERFEDYVERSPYFGATVGRYANRIAGGSFTIEGRRYQADRNYLDKHTLHGGGRGFAKRLWTITDQGPEHVILKLRDPDGAGGFPGTLEVSCAYRLKVAGTLSIEYRATCDQPTLCNLAHHSYFNLDDGGAGDALDHRLMLAAAAYLPVDGEMIPTGVVQPLDGTPFDFRQARPIRTAGEQVPFDHNFCLAAARGPLRQAAWAQGASGVELELWTTEPGIQFYAGHMVPRLAGGLDGRTYGPFSGFCLEAQVWPDSPNRPYFPQAVLWPGDVYHQTTEYRFRLP